MPRHHPDWLPLARPYTDKYTVQFHPCVQIWFSDRFGIMLLFFQGHQRDNGKYPDDERPSHKSPVYDISVKTSANPEWHAYR